MNRETAGVGTAVVLQNWAISSKLLRGEAWAGFCSPAPQPAAQAAVLPGPHLLMVCF